MNEEQKHSRDLPASNANFSRAPALQKKGIGKRRGFLLLALALVVTIAGVVFWQVPQARAMFQVQATSDTSAKSAYKTTTVRRSDLSLAISGSGTVITSKTVDLGFLVSGTLAELNVAPGDEVTEGQVLASLGDTAALKQTIIDQTLAVTVAQKKLDDLLSGGSSTLARAQADQASLAKAYADAQAAVHHKGDSRCTTSKSQEYYFKYIYAQKAVDEWEGYLNDPNTGYGRDYILEQLRPLRQARDEAYGNLTFCQGYTDTEITDSQANLQLAKAKLDQASTAYESLKASAGVDQTAVAIAEATLENAKLQLSKAQTQLAGTTITAPMNGTVTAVNAKAGDEVTTSTLITLADLNQAEVQIYMDETDLSNFAVGCPAAVTFDSVPGETFPGTVTQISPVMVTVNNSNMIEGFVELEKKELASGKKLSVGMTASVEVTCSESKNALTVPLTALYQPEGAPEYVYVLNSQNQPEKREVVVGLKTIASAEITSGLSEGETIITSKVESQ